MNLLQRTAARLAARLNDFAGYKSFAVTPESAGLIFSEEGITAITPDDLSDEISRANLLVISTLMVAMRDGHLFEACVLAALEAGYPHDDALEAAGSFQPEQGEAVA